MALRLTYTSGGVDFNIVARSTDVEMLPDSRTVASANAACNLHVIITFMLLWQSQTLHETVLCNITLKSVERLLEAYL